MTVIRRSGLWLCLLAIALPAVAATSVSISLSPLTAALTTAQTKKFTATVKGASNTAVTWALSPAVGSLSAAGIYTPPAVIAAPQRVSVTATSVADQTKSASAAVTLAPSVVMSLTPPTATLTTGQTKQFNATVKGASNIAVTWTLRPIVGTISATGLYTAPASISTPEFLIVTATSVADPTKSVRAPIGIQLPVSISLTPLSTTLAAGQSTQFAATVSGASNSAITWKLSPAVGSVSAQGLYTAPAAALSAQTLTLTATSRADPAKVAAATIALTVHTAGPQRSTKYGVHMDLTWFGDPNYRNARVHAAAQVGAQIGRNTLLWSLIEQTEGKLDWTDCDSIVSQMFQEDIEPLFSVFGSPSWANGSDPSAAAYYDVPQDPVAFQNWVDAYARFLSAATRRYKGKVHKWELGNEQNWEGYWSPRPNLDQYVYWYRALSAAILAEDPSAEIAVGGLCLLTRKDSEIPPNISGISFIKGLWLRGLYPHAIAIHPYITTNGNQSSAPMIDVQAVTTVHDLLVSNGSSSTDLWITEFGWLGAPVTPDLRAKALSTVLSQIDACFSTFVQVAIYFPLFDNPPYTAGGLYDYSLQVTPSGTSFGQFMTATSNPPNTTSCPIGTP